jgi:hypothetical protein
VTEKINQGRYPPRRDSLAKSEDSRPPRIFQNKKRRKNNQTRTSDSSSKDISNGSIPILYASNFPDSVTEDVQVSVNLDTCHLGSIPRSDYHQVGAVNHAAIPVDATV